MGGQALLSAGGKGANQAHAARLYGAAVRMVGAVGADAFSVPALVCLKQAGVDISGIDIVAQQATGLAMIVLDANGENAIVVAPGANLAARAEQLDDQALLATRVLLLQLETDIEQTMMLARRAKSLGCTVMLNASPLGQTPGPASSPHAQIDLSAIDTLIVNRGELEQLARLTGVQGADATPAELAPRMARQYANQVLVTLGAGGAVLAGADGALLSVPALQVAVVDTTGAGDTFAGVYAAAIAGGEAPRRALRLAAAAAGLACTRRGAQLAQPQRQEIEQCMSGTTDQSMEPE
jgi:ribokinase